MDELFMENIDLIESKNEPTGIINSVSVLERRISLSVMTFARLVVEFSELYPPADVFALEIRLNRSCIRASSTDLWPTEPMFQRTEPAGL